MAGGLFTNIGKIVDKLKERLLGITFANGYPVELREVWTSRDPTAAGDLPASHAPIAVLLRGIPTARAEAFRRYYVEHPFELSIYFHSLDSELAEEAGDNWVDAVTERISTTDFQGGCHRLDLDEPGEIIFHGPVSLYEVRIGFRAFFIRRSDTRRELEPVINTLSATPSGTQSPATPVTIAWTSTNCDTMTIDQGLGARSLDGSVVVTPVVTTTYTLTGVGPGGSVIRSITLVRA